jgi:hypothetical protein
MKIIIFKGKHGDRYFDASTKEAVHKACLKIFKERNREGWYGHINEAREPVEPFKFESICTIENEQLRNHATNLWKDYQRELRDYLSIQIEQKQYKDACGDKTGMAAYRFLCSRQDGEYEQFVIENLEKV